MRLYCSSQTVGSVIALKTSTFLFLCFDKMPSCELDSTCVPQWLKMKMTIFPTSFSSNLLPSLNQRPTLKGERKLRNKPKSRMRRTDSKVGGSANRSQERKVSAKVYSNGPRKRRNLGL